MMAIILLVAHNFLILLEWMLILIYFLD